MDGFAPAFVETSAVKSGKWDSNPRPSAWEADALPLSYSRLTGSKFS